VDTLTPPTPSVPSASSSPVLLIAFGVVAVGDKKVRRDESAALAVKHDDRQVAHLLAARHALAQARTVPEVKRILDVSAAAEIDATRQKLSDEAIGSRTPCRSRRWRSLGICWKRCRRPRAAPNLASVGEERMRFLQGTRWSTGRPGAEHG
jgi:hypothetical protein